MPEPLDQAKNITDTTKEDRAGEKKSSQVLPAAHLRIATSYIP